LDLLLRAAVLCNEGDLHRRDGEWLWHGDPTDVALLTMAHKLGIVRMEMLNAYAQINEIPFDPAHRFAATYHAVNGATRVYAKGAPERILAMCDLNQEGSGRKPLEDMAVEMAETGYRVLAFAEGPAPRLTSEDTPPQPEGLRFLGFVGMIDPLRPGVNDAIAACRQAGIAVSMVTGDHPVTALAIAKELGLASGPEQVMVGPELEDKPLQEIQNAVERVRVFARVAPHQKLQIVQAARASGHFVAVTGDGVNDAPALRAANIGVAMGKAGTDVARDAADLVISDDNFATIVAGVEEGRVAYDNVRKVIYLLISTGAAEVVLMAATLASGFPLPLLPVQLLWLNLVTNGIQDVALAFEPSEGDVLKRRPRPTDEPIFNRLMIERTLVGGLTIAAVGFAAFWWMIAAGWEEASARNILLLLMVLFENIHIGNCRSETKSAFRLSPLRSPILLGGALLALLVHIGAMYWPAAQAVLGTEPVTFSSAGILLLLALSVLLTMELHKWIWRLRQRRATQ
jgi:magnesium-transporting ATPase (P-type)